jgi:hypothetical protein
VVDGVSRDGTYKVTAIWEYDKRSVNDANFVYFGMKLRSAAGERERAIIEYAKRVVEAVGIMQGPSHMEVMYCADGPCLVEVGSRCHGGEGTWLPVAQECVGYTQLSAALDSYLRPDRFEALPMAPMSLLNEGGEAFLVSTYNGTYMFRAVCIVYRDAQWRGPRNSALSISRERYPHFNTLISIRTPPARPTTPRHTYY